MSAPSRCTAPDCTALATAHGRCARHERPPWQRRSRAWDTVSRRRWGKNRAIQLRAEPLCRVCGAVAVQVDHVVPISDGGAMWDRANYQSLCRKHHDEKSRRETAAAHRRAAAQRRSDADNG